MQLPAGPIEIRGSKPLLHGAGGAPRQAQVNFFWADCWPILFAGRNVLHSCREECNPPSSIYIYVYILPAGRNASGFEPRISIGPAVLSHPQATASAPAHLPNLSRFLKKWDYVHFSRRHFDSQRFAKMTVFHSKWKTLFH